MKARGLPSALAFGLALASASAVSTSARADEPLRVTSELTPPETLPTHVLVHVESPKPVALESRAPGEHTWTTACGMPCDRELPLADEYRFANGPTFRLNPSSGSFVLLKVHPATAVGQAGGAALLGVGAIFAVIGAAGVLVGVAAAAQPTPTCDDHSSDWCGAGPGLGKGIALISLVPLLVGGMMVAGGASILSDSSKTSTTQRPWRGREPTWVGPQSSAPKKAGFVPLSFSF